MRRFAWLAVALSLSAGLTGCSNFRDLFSAHADVAAEAGRLELPAERLAEIMLGAVKTQRLTRETAEVVADTWVDYALFAQAVARDALPTDSASVAEAVWPEVAELKGTHFHDSLMAARTTFSDTAADSLYQAPDMRLLQHILFGSRGNQPAEQRAEVRKKAEETLTRIRRGADFGKLAAELSEDPGSRADSGFLAPGPRGRYVPAFDSAGWALRPGQTSDLVETPFGYHIIRRPELADVRGRLTDYLSERAGVRLDSLYMDSLATASDIRIQSGAPAGMRAALDAPEDHRRSDKALSTFKGGSLTVQEFLRWVRALPPPYAGQLRQADDSTLARFARILTQNVLLLREADRAGIRVSPLEWQGMQQRYLAQLDTLKMEMGLAGADVNDSTVSPQEREKVAGLKMEQYFDQLVSGSARLRPLPSALATLLRERMPYRVHEAGVTRALEIGKELKGGTDSAAAPSPLQRAPGPPPVPGAMPPGSGDAPPGQ